MLPNYDLIDDFLPYGSMKATAGQNILLGVFSAARRNFSEYNARQMILVENVLVKSHKMQVYIIFVVLTLVYLQNLHLFHVMIHWWVRKPPRGPNNCMFWAMIEAESEAGRP